MSKRAFMKAVLCGLLAGFTAPGSAHALEPPIVTNQANAARAGFLAYAPPPAGGARALCLVDTGVNATQDTAPGLVSATALDGGTGADVDPLLHGTNDAVIAGGAGHTLIGAWPYLKIVSIRATDVPQPGKQPTFQYNDYVQGIKACTAPVGQASIAAIDLPLASSIPPTSDQEEEFNNAVEQAHGKGIAILAAAGNDRGPIQLPGSQSGILPVGAGDPDNAICAFSASTGLTFFAPGCGIHQIDAQGRAVCCGNGTSQASAFASAVLVALRSYNTSISADDAVAVLLRTARRGHLDVAAAFRSAGLAQIVKAGRAAIPKRPGRPRVRRASWHRGLLHLSVAKLSKGTTLRVELRFARRDPRVITTTKSRLHVRTPLPRRVVLHLTIQTPTRILSGPASTVRVKRTRLRR